MNAAQIISHVDNLVSDIETAKMLLADSKSALHSFVTGLRNEVFNGAAVGVATKLYWNYPMVTTQSIAEGILHCRTNEVCYTVEKPDVDLRCDECGAPLNINSRAHIVSIKRNDWDRKCGICREKIDKERNEQWIERDKNEERRIQELRKMPYRDYLQTEHWQTTRQQHLKRIGYKCQICNASGVTIDIHHRTYERRGAEYYKDLIALCRDCHDIFHKNRKVVQ